MQQSISVRRSFGCVFKLPTRHCGFANSPEPIVPTLPPIGPSTYKLILDVAGLPAGRLSTAVIGSIRRRAGWGCARGGTSPRRTRDQPAPEQATAAEARTTRADGRLASRRGEETSRRSGKGRADGRHDECRWRRRSVRHGGRGNWRQLARRSEALPEKQSVRSPWAGGKKPSGFEGFDSAGIGPMPEFSTKPPIPPPLARIDVAATWVIP